MLSSSQRLAVRVRRRETLDRMLLLSLALHLAVFLSLLIIPSTPPPTGGSGPPSVEVMADEGTAEGVKLPTPSYAPAAEVPAMAPPPPPSAPAFAVPTEAVPAVPVQPPAPTEATAVPIAPPAPDVPPPTEVPQTQIPPPTPAPAPMPVPPAPTEVAALQPPPPAPAPPPQPQSHPAAAQPPAPPRYADARLAPPQLAAARPAPARPVPPSRATVNSAGAPPHSTDGQDASSRANGANQGNGWIGKLQQWWEQHKFYPEEASQSNQGGDVKVHMVIAPDGQITSIEVVRGSGSSALDMAAVAVFRNAHLPPFPPGTPAPPADVEVSLHYLAAHSGG